LAKTNLREKKLAHLQQEHPSLSRSCHRGDPGGRLVANIMHFARALRAAGLPIGPGRVIEAVRAVETAGIGDRDDF